MSDRQGGGGGGGRSSRRLIYRIHAWIGLNLGLALLVICLSGTLAVFGPELNWLADPAMRVEPPPAGERPAASWERVREAVSAAFPEALLLFLQAPRGARWPALATISYGSGNTRTVLVDPHDGRIIGQKGGFNLASFLRVFHKQFYIVPVNLWIHGTLIVGALGIPLLMALVAGLLSVKRWWRALFTLRAGRSRTLFWSDLHRFTGVWSLLIAIVFAVTGIWYLAENIMIGSGVLLEDARPPRLAAETLRERPPDQVPLDLDRAVANARAAHPELQVSRMALPLRPGDPLFVVGQAETWVVRDRANAVALDPYTGAVLQVQRGGDLGILDRWIHTADPLHFGTFGGLVSRIIWFAAGIAICAGILAGMYGAWLRLGKRRAHGRTRAGRALPAALAAVVPTIVLVAAAIYGTWAYGLAPHQARQPMVLLASDPVRIGPWTVQAARPSGNASERSSVDLILRFRGAAQPIFRDAELWLGDAVEPPAGGTARRFVDRLAARLDDPHGICRGTCSVTLRLTEWDGTRHRAVVELKADIARRIEIAGGAPLTAGEVAAIAVFAISLLLLLPGWSWLLFNRALRA